MKSFEDIQGPTYDRTECVFRRQPVYGYDAPIKGSLRPKHAIAGQNVVAVNGIALESGRRS